MVLVIEHRRALVRGFIDGTLTTEEHAALEVALRDSDTARHFLRELHLDQAIRVAAHAQQRRAELEADPQAPSTARFRARRSSRWRPRLSPWSWAGSAAAAVIVALTALLAMNWPTTRNPLAQLVVHLGTVNVGEHARNGASDIYNSDDLRVSPRGWASLRLTDGTLIELESNTTVHLERTDAGMRVQITQGAVKADVRRQPVGRPLIIESPRSRATVLGTRLGFATLPEGDRVDVTHGLVRCAKRSDGSSIDVPAGSQVDIRLDAPLALAPIRPPGPLIPDPPRSGLLAWLDPAQGVELDDHGRVARWNERIQSQFVLQENPAQRPVFTLEGRPAIHFAPRGEGLSGRVPWPTTGAFTVALALRPTHLGRWSQSVGWGWGCFAFHAQDDGGIYAGVGAPGGGIRFVPGSEPEDIPPGTAVIGRWQRYIICYGHGVGAFYADGNLIARKAMPAPEAREMLHLGRTDTPEWEPSSFAGDLAGLLLYDRALEPQEITQLDRHLRGVITP